MQLIGHPERRNCADVAQFRSRRIFCFCFGFRFRLADCWGELRKTFRLRFYLDYRRAEINTTVASSNCGWPAQLIRLPLVALAADQFCAVRL
jgi:hypothetical protein